MLTLTAAHKRKIRENVHADKITFKKDGTVQFKQGYFYRMGVTPAKVSERVQANLEKLGFQATATATHDSWSAWPKTSYFVAEFQITGETKCIT